MENSSKALLIAAAVLIAVILIAMGIKILSPTQDIAQQTEGVGNVISNAEQDAIGKIQSSFDKYFGAGGAAGGAGGAGGPVGGAGGPIGGGVGVKWTQEGATLTKTNADGTKIQVKIGDYVNYNEGTYTHTPEVAKGAGTSKVGGNSSTGYTLATSELSTEDLSWRILGVNAYGQLELISADPTTQKLYLANREGYINAEDNLNNFCNDLYGKGTYAIGARSLNVDDINNLKNYDPTTFNGYGNKWTYRYPTTEEVSGTRYMQYRTEKPDGTLVTDWTNITNSKYQTFRLPEETTAISNINAGSREVIFTNYNYNIANNLTTDDGFTAEEVTTISNVITKGITNSNIRYILASRSVQCYKTSVDFKMRIVSSGVVSVYAFALFNSRSSNDYLNYQVRPVVTLSSGVSLTGAGSDIGSSGNMWNIELN